MKLYSIGLDKNSDNLKGISVLHFYKNQMVYRIVGYIDYYMFQSFDVFKNGKFEKELL